MKSYVQKATVSAAVLALTGFHKVDAMRIDRSNKPISNNLVQVNSDVKQKKPDADNIASASADDMYAFSQIIASGNKVSTVTDAMDKENETHPE